MPRQRASIALPRTGSIYRSRTRGPFGSNSSKSKQPARRVTVLRCAWAVAVLWGEYLVFWLSVKACDWPQVDTRSETSAGLGTRVLVLTDPQIPDWRSYADRNFLLRGLGESIINNFVRKGWSLVTNQHRPHHIIFLGDLLDSAIYNTDRLEHAEYVSRFKSIFSIPSYVDKVLYCVGNHDTGLGLPKSQASHAREQFRDAFNPLQGIMELGNHSVVWVDSQALIEERHLGNFDHGLTAKPNSAWGFLHRLGKQELPLPTLLLSHIPLHRPEGTYCGKERESKLPIRAGHGLNYQNLMDQDTSEVLLEALQPSLVLSGDDHDSCVVEHAIQSPASWTSKVKEITVKSFAMNMNVRRPGYQLMTLSNSARARPTDGSSTVATQSCLLPYQIGVYLHLYVPLLLLTLGWLFVPKILKSWRTRRVSTAKGSKLPSHARSSSRKHSRNISRFTTESSDSDSGDEYGYGSSFTPAAEYSSYSYHTDEDGLPTPATATVFERNAPRVRRVSRVHLWDGRRSRDPDLGLTPSLQLLGRLGPVTRYGVRPAVRLLRRLWAWTLASLWNRLGGRQQLLVQALVELWQVLWVAVALVVAIALRFYWF